jgi:anti-sigma regulatory factor (Ser/Thr protein kinase)
LVEDRKTSLDVGMECLRTAIGDEFADVEDLADHVLDVCLGDRTIDDDTALLILRATAIGNRLSVRLPTEPRILGQFRQTLRRWLQENSVPESDALDVLVACGEACNNAIEHGSAARNGSFEVEAHVDGDLDIVVRNEGTWRAPRDDGGGRGLPVMEGLMDDVKIDRSSGTIEVRLHKTLRPRVSA